jgi:hypothetical protein
MSRKTTRSTPLSPRLVSAVLGQTLQSLVEACRDIRIISRAG